jgi:type I restriction enzyme S subunit
MKWQEQTLGEICDEEGGTIQTGPFGSQLHQTDYQEEGIPVVMPQDIIDGRINLNSVAKVSEEIANRPACHKLKVGAIVMPRRGEVNKRAFVTEEEQGYLCGTGCVKIELGGKVLEPRFLYYYLEQPQVVGWIEQHAVGTTMLNLNTTIVREVPIRYPQLEEQRRIASILSSYDDVIENNLRRMALLEESARLLYREWFVCPRFPGHEHTRIVNGVPEGWDAYVLDDLCLIGRGASPRPINDFMGGNIPWFKIGDATASESCFIFHTREHVTEDGARKSISLEPDSLILSNSATCGIPYFTGVNGCIHDGWLHFSDFKRVSKRFLYCYLYFKREELVSSVSDGSTQKNLNTAVVGRLKIILPPHDTLLQQFEDTVQPVFSMIQSLARQNISLRAARDLLLPRLMSGEIAV